MEEAPTILVENLMSAFYDAIETAKKREDAAGYTRPSCYRAALMQNLEYLRKHRRLEVVDR